MDAERFLKALEGERVNFFVGVPDSYLHGFCELLRDNKYCNVIAANEGNAVAIAAGYHLGTGATPLVYMQNSGLGNAVNPLVSLAGDTMLGIPMLLLIGWRGDPFHNDHVQHKLQGRITPTLLNGMHIPYQILNGDGVSNVCWAVAEAARTKRPVALLAPKGMLDGTKKGIRVAADLLSREDAIGIVLDELGDNVFYSATTGRASRELYHLRDARGEGHEYDYLNVGAMGHASSVAFGIALARPGNLTVCLDGDAAIIMHMGALAVQGSCKPSNLIHIAFNNGEHESVGGEPSAARAIDLTAVAAACGYRTVHQAVSSREEIESALKELRSCGGPSFLEVAIRPGIRADLPPLEIEPKVMRDELMACLGMMES